MRVYRIINRTLIELANQCQTESEVIDAMRQRHRAIDREQPGFTQAQFRSLVEHGYCVGWVLAQSALTEPAKAIKII